MPIYGEAEFTMPLAQVRPLKELLIEILEYLGPDANVVWGDETLCIYAQNTTIRTIGGTLGNLVTKCQRYKLEYEFIQKDENNDDPFGSYWGQGMAEPNWLATSFIPLWPNNWKGERLTAELAIQKLTHI